MLENVEINFTDPSLGNRLRAAYWSKHGLKPPERTRRIQLLSLMSVLFEAGRTDGFRLRRCT